MATRIFSSINRRIVTAYAFGRVGRQGSGLGTLQRTRRESFSGAPEGETDAERIVAVFPREWLRDHCSHHLVESHRRLSRGTTRELFASDGGNATRAVIDGLSDSRPGLPAVSDFAAIPLSAAQGKRTGG